MKQNVISKLVLELLAGKSRVEAFDKMSMEALTNHVRLRHAFEDSGVSNVSDFLELGTNRMGLRNYGNLTELKLKQSLEGFLSKQGDDISIVANKESSDVIHHDDLIAALSNKKSLLKNFNEKHWKRISADLMNSDLRFLSIGAVAAEIKMDWPYSSQSPDSDKLIGDFLDYSIAELFNLHRWGFYRVRTYTATVIHLHRRKDIDIKNAVSNLKDAVLTVWNNSGLDERGKRVVQLRCGIETRKHTLFQLEPIYGVSRERLRQIQKDSIDKLRRNTIFPKFGELLAKEKETIWRCLSNGPRLSKSNDLKQLQRDLPFVYHLALVLLDQSSHRRIEIPLLKDWLDANFKQDESNWYN